MNLQILNNTTDKIIEHSADRPTKRIMMDNSADQIILAKSALILNQMQKKMSLGADGLEIQLLGELIDTPHTFKNYEEAFPDFDKLLEIPVYSIHAPLVNYIKALNKKEQQKLNISCNIEQLTHAEYKELFRQIFRMAQAFANHQKHRVNIVVHTEINFTLLTTIYINIYNNIRDCINELLSQFKDVDICIENVSPVRAFNKQEKYVRLGNNFGFDGIELVKQLRKDLSKGVDTNESNRVFNTFDTCHAEVTNRFMGMLSLFYPGKINIKEYELHEYFQKYAETTRIVHLSITRGNGVGNKSHGQPFKTADDKQTAEYYISELKRTKFSAYYVLEVAEEDYDTSDGFASSEKIIRKILSET